MTQAPPPEPPAVPQQPSYASPQQGGPQKRPGGLTALAVLNFVFGGLGIIGSFLLLGLLSVTQKAAN